MPKIGTGPAEPFYRQLSGTSIEEMPSLGHRISRIEPARGESLYRQLSGTSLLEDVESAIVNNCDDQLDGKTFGAGCVQQEEGDSDGGNEAAKVVAREKFEWLTSHGPMSRHTSAEQTALLPQPPKPQLEDDDSDDGNESLLQAKSVAREKFEWLTSHRQMTWSRCNSIEHSVPLPPQLLKA
eukprot:CAMPEP_0179140724 /NCGR_PEP_ID=MMETSP0796-20121207/67417_1 /TAXON_ID=73915 /ORGANISM="Pyrodinium bahamense, Strain pbaha01" /LENGTH=181 /DNA_ID=CAMNT_0020840323 /DNA_START=1 /DNA_END=542 /DNA_ORIENTATION=+